MAKALCPILDIDIVDGDRADRRRRGYASRRTLKVVALGMDGT